MLPSSSPNQKIDATDSHRSLSTKTGYCQRQSSKQSIDAPKKTQRRRATMPDSRGFHFDSNNVVKMHNTSYGKPRYIVEVFINSTDDVDFSANRISYRQSIKTSKPEEAPKIPKNVETHTIQRDSSTSHNTRFKTTIYLGPDRTSTIEEPPRCSKIQASQHKLIPYRKNCRSHHERVINQNSLLKLKHSNPNSIDHY